MERNIRKLSTYMIMLSLCAYFFTLEIATTSAANSNTKISADELAYWQLQAALLDPLTHVHIFQSGKNWSITVPTGKTWHLRSAFWVSINGQTHPNFHRNPEPDQVMALPAGTTLEAHSGSSQSHLTYVDPGIVTDSGSPDYDSRYITDPKGLYFSRLARLKTLPLHIAEAKIPKGSAYGKVETAAFPKDFTYGLVVQQTVFDASWTILYQRGKAAMNLGTELSDNKTVRFTNEPMVPFERALFTAIAVRGGNRSDTNSSYVEGFGSIGYVKLPDGW
jgi:hypothetical protein